MWEMESVVDSDTEAVVDGVAEGVTECPDCDTEMVVGTLSVVEMVKLSVSAIDAVAETETESVRGIDAVADGDFESDADKDVVTVVEGLESDPDNVGAMDCVWEASSVSVGTRDLDCVKVAAVALSE